MARFDVFANPVVAERKQIPYLLDVQNDYIDSIATRVVVPLWREAEFGPCARNLNPVFVIASDKVVLDTAALAAVPRTELRKPLLSLREARAVIQEALDTLFGSH